MKRLFIFISSIVLILILAYCSSKNYIITSNYQDITFDNAVVLIPPVNISEVNDLLEIFSVEEIDKIKDDFNIAVSDSMDEYLSEYTASNVKIYSTEYKTEPQFTERSLNIGDDEITFTIPANSVEVENKVDGNQFILFIENPVITLDKGKKNSSSSGMPGMDGTTGATSASSGKMKASVVSLSMDVAYVLYDNTNEQAAYYGVAHYNESFKKLEEVKSIIERGLKNISKGIISNSPVK